MWVRMFYPVKVIDCYKKIGNQHLYFSISFMITEISKRRLEYQHCHLVFITSIDGRILFEENLVEQRQQFGHPSALEKNEYR